MDHQEHAGLGANTRHQPLGAVNVSLGNRLSGLPDVAVDNLCPALHHDTREDRGIVDAECDPGVATEIDALLQVALGRDVEDLASPAIPDGAQLRWAVPTVGCDDCVLPPGEK